MVDVNLCFEVHQPMRLRPYYYDHNSNNIMDRYFDFETNKGVLARVINKCYMPTTNIIARNIETLGKKFKVSYSISGTLLDQFEEYFPEMIEIFQDLADTGNVEFLSQTYHHSLASLYGTDRSEFVKQVGDHRDKIRDLFNYKTRIFENTEFIYNNMIAKTVDGMGFKGIFTEGIDHILGWRSPNFLYSPKESKNGIKVLTRNYKLSDDFSYRFSARWWEEWPLTSEKYAAWLSATQGDVLNLFVDYETFGEHQWPETGIFGFLGQLPHEVLKYKNMRFTTPSISVEKYPARDVLDVFEMNTISWADIERDTSAWLGNDMQRKIFEELKSLQPLVEKKNDPKLTKIWGYLQNSDHLYFMCTKWWGDGDVHKYFSPYEKPQDGFNTMKKIINEFRQKLLE